MPVMHAGTLVVRPLTVLGATLKIAGYDGSTVPLRSAMTSLNIEGDRVRGAEKKLGLVKLFSDLTFCSSYSTVSLTHSCMKLSRRLISANKC